MAKTNWVKDNWAFLSARNKKFVCLRSLEKMMRDGEVPSNGRFYGSESVLRMYDSLSAVTSMGGRKLMLRPYIVCDTPSDVIACVYADRKQYKFDKDGKITGLSSLYEAPIYVVVI